MKQEFSICENYFEKEQCHKALKTKSTNFHTCLRSFDFQIYKVCKFFNVFWELRKWTFTIYENGCDAGGKSLWEFFWDLKIPELPLKSLHTFFRNGVLLLPYCFETWSLGATLLKVWPGEGGIFSSEWHMQFSSAFSFVIMDSPPLAHCWKKLPSLPTASKA